MHEIVKYVETKLLYWYCVVCLSVCPSVGIKGERETGGCPIRAVVVGLGYRLGHWEWTSGWN